MQLVQMRSIHTLLKPVITTWQMRDGTQGAIFMYYKQYHGNQALQANMEWTKVIQAMLMAYSPVRWDFVQDEGNFVQYSGYSYNVRS